MRSNFVLIIIILIGSQHLFGQGFSYTDSSSGVSGGCDPSAPIYDFGVNYTVNISGTSGKPISISHSSYCSSDDPADPSYIPINCIGIVETTTLPSNDCYSGTFSIGGGICATANLFISWQPINLTISGSVPAVYCADQTITLTAPNYYQSYIWEYSTQTGVWNPFLTTPSASISVGVNDIFGGGAGTYLLSRGNIFFRYQIAGCGTISGVSGAYSFSANQITAVSPSSVAPICAGGSDGSISFSISRSLLSGESYVPSLYTAPNLGSIYRNGGVNSTTFGSLPAGTYYILIESSYGNCGLPQFIPATVNAGPRTPISASATITSNYNGFPISCPGINDGQITVAASGGNGSFTYSLDGGAYQGSPVFSSVGSGNHAVTVQDGCTIPSTATTNQVTLNPPPGIVVSSVTPSLCNIGSSGQITIVASGGGGGLSYSINDGANYQISNIFTGLAAGFYTIRVRGLNNCFVPAGTAIIPDPIFAGSALSTQPICFGDIGTIAISGTSGGTGALTWSIGGAFQSVATPFAVLAGTYSVTVRDANGCTAGIATPVTLTNPPAITLANSIVNPACFGAANGTITVTATNGSGSLEYSNDGGVNFQSSNTFNASISAGSYSMVVRDAIGCLSLPSTAVVGQPTALGGSIASPPPFSCFNIGNSASLDLTPSGGTPPYTYLWSTGSILEDISVTLGTSLSTNYSVTITDSQGCVNSRNINVTQPADLTSIIAPTHITCFSANNGLIDLTPQGGTSPFSFLWNTGAVTEDLSSLSPGMYSVTITDANGCITSNSTIITEPPLLTLAQGLTTNVLCNGQSNGTSNLIANGGTGTYEYSKDGITWQASSLITGLNAANQTLRVRDQNFCTTQISVVITEPPVLSVSTGSIVGSLCKLPNGSAQSSGTGGTGSYSFEWRDIMNQVVSTSSDLTNVPGGVYRVTITDQNGCTDFEDIAIASPDGPQIAINTLTSTQCSYTNDGAATITVASGQAPYSIVWNNGEAGLNPIALRPGTNVNFVTVTDATSCVAALAVNVPSPPVLQVNTTTLLQPTCPGGSDGSVQTLAQGGTGSYSFTWNTGATGSLLSPVPSGNYQVTVRDINNCTAVLPVILASKSPIAIQVNSVAPICLGGSDGSVNVNATGANGSFAYTWSNGASGPALSNIRAGTYTVIATDLLNCTAQQLITIVDPPPVQLNLGPDRKICEGGTLILASPVDASAYTWSSPNGFSSTAKQVAISQLGNYTLQITNAAGCTGEDTFTLTTATDLLKADFLMATEVFEGDTVIVIDISWPLPESVSWRLPAEGRVISQSSEYVEIIFDNSGTYPIGLDAAIANCQDNHSQNIRVLSGSRPQQGGRVKTERLIENVTLHPNPNRGEFSVEVDLSEAATVEFTIVNLEGNKIVARNSTSGDNHYIWSVGLPQLEQGVYFVLVKAGSENKAVRFIKI